MAGRLSGLMRTAAVLALVLPAGATAARAETLGNALASAYRNSNLLEQNEALMRSVDEDVAQAVAKLRPVLAWALQSQYFDVPLAGTSTSGSLGLNLDWDIYNFGRGKLDVELAEEAVLVTQQTLRIIEQTVLLNAVAAYMDVRRASQDVEVNRNSVNVTQEELNAVNDRFAVGQITRTDVALTEAQLAAAKAFLAAAEGSLGVARATYKAAIGHDWDGQSSVPATPALPKTLAEAQGIAQRLHPAILRAQHQVALADLAVARAHAETMPTLGLNIQAGVDGGGDNSSQASIELAQPLFTGGRIASGERQAIAEAQAAKSALLQTTVDLMRDVAASWSDVEISATQITAIGEQINAAQIAYDGIREEAALGARTTLDVLIAERQLLQAQSDMIAAEARQQVAIYSLLATMGLLTVENLRLGVPVYDPSAYFDVVKTAPLSVQGEKLDRVLQAIGKD